MMVSNSSDLKNQSPDSIIHREEKGLTILFFPEYVIKDFKAEPTDRPQKDQKHYGKRVDREEQTRRFTNELKAYQRLKELQCPFAPELLDFSVEERWFAIRRVYGMSLLDISQTPKGSLPMKSILQQLDEINLWLKESGFGHTRHNTKDVILDPSGKLYLLDFEGYAPGESQTSDVDIYDTLLKCVLERILIRKGRRAKFTPQFLRLSLGIIGKRPLKAIKYSLGYLDLIYYFIVDSRPYAWAKRTFRSIKE